MVSLTLSSLLDLCSIRVAYMMWTRHDIYKCCSNMYEWNKFEEVVLIEVQGLPLPERVIPQILKFVKPAGECLMQLLNVWLLNTQPMSSQKYLPSDILHESLIMNGLGLINHRETARKILSSRLLHNVFAFRLACVNFLQEEVLKLWPFVMEYFLNNLVRQRVDTLGNNRDISISEFPTVTCRHSCPIIHPSIDLKTYFEFESDFNHRPTVESYEVMFWICWCLSKYHDANLQSLLGCLETNGWHKLIIDSAFNSGNFAFIQLYRNYSKEPFNFNYEEIVQKYVSFEGYSFRESFVYFYTMLNSQRKLKLFETQPKKTIYSFLQWPLSLTFMEKTEEMWNLIGNQERKWLLTSLFGLVFKENKRIMNVIVDNFLNSNALHKLSLLANSRLHIKEHLISIFINLWEISSDDLKSSVLDFCIFTNSTYYKPSSFQWSNKILKLKQNLLRLFLDKVEAVLELSKKRPIKSSLRKIVSKYEQYFRDLDKDCIAFLREESPDNDSRYRSFLRHRRLKNTSKLRFTIKEKFRNYMKELLFLSNTNNGSYLY